MMGVIEAVTQSARNGTYLREKTLAHWIGMISTSAAAAATIDSAGRRSADRVRGSSASC